MISTVSVAINSGYNSFCLVGSVGGKLLMRVTLQADECSTLLQTLLFQNKKLGSQCHLSALN